MKKQKVILQLAMTIDGYIARTDGSVDFLGNMGEDTADMFDTFLSKIDIIVMGRKTYDQMVSFGDIPFTNKRIIVLSTRELDKTYPHVEVKNSAVKPLFDTLDGTVWLFGGANVIKDCMNADLVDELELFIVPIVLGQGIPLFHNVKESNDWTLMNQKKFGNNILLHYKKTSNE